MSETAPSVSRVDRFLAVDAAKCHGCGAAATVQESLLARRKSVGSSKLDLPYSFTMTVPLCDACHLKRRVPATNTRQAAINFLGTAAIGAAVLGWHFSHSAWDNRSARIWIGAAVLAAGLAAAAPYGGRRRAARTLAELHPKHADLVRAGYGFFPSDEPATPGAGMPSRRR